jgi:hypothetical protein
VAQSSDELIKREVSDKVGSGRTDLTLRIFPSTSNKDQESFSTGGLTFGVDGISYGSCDAAWLTTGSWIDGFDRQTYQVKPVLALEGTNALNTGSSGNAQYQRFHHSLGAVRNGVVGVYYLRKGKDKVREELHGMAVAASTVEGTAYVVTDDLSTVKNLLINFDKPELFDELLNASLDTSRTIFNKYFEKNYGNWNTFAQKRSTVLVGDTAIKHAGRMKRNFTDSSQRAGHIAVGEMYLTKYLFPEYKIDYLWPRMSRSDIEELDISKQTDKEWRLLRNEPNVRIVTRDELNGLEKTLKDQLISLQNEPLKGRSMSQYREIANKIQYGLETDRYAIDFQP